MSGKRLAILSLLALSCSITPGPGTGRITEPPDVLSSKMHEMAQAMVGQLTSGSRVVVANFMPLTRPQASMLGVYLAKRFSTVLYEVGKGRIVVVDRGQAVRIVAEEMRYTVSLQDPKKLLERFQADYAVVATYNLRKPDCVLELVELKAIPTSGAEVTFGSNCLLRGSPGDFDYWLGLDGQLLPNMSEKLSQFLAENGKWDAVETPAMQTRAGQTVSANGNVKTGTEVKLKIRVKTQCHLYVLGWDQTNSIMTMLFPMQGQQSLTGPGEYMLPVEGFYVTQPPLGYNWVKAVATRSDIGLVAGDAFIQDPEAQDAQVDKILGLGEGNWGAAVFGYYIVE
jgi:hypothetical protein